jgi:hypothetical protein
MNKERPSMEENKHAQRENSLREQVENPEARANLAEILDTLEDKNRRGELRDMPKITITFGGGENLGWTIVDKEGRKSVTQIGNKGKIEI